MLRLSDLPAEVQARVRGQAAGKKRSKIIGGGRARRSGDCLEKKIMTAAAAQSAIVELEDLPKCGAKFVGRGRSKALPICCDFIGTVVGPGTAIYFDAKRTERQYAIDLGDPKILKAHQAVFLSRHAAAGAIAGILVESPTGFRWLDGRHLPGSGSVKWGDPRWALLGSSIDFTWLLSWYQRGGMQ